MATIGQAGEYDDGHPVTIQAEPATLSVQAQSASPRIEGRGHLVAPAVHVSGTGTVERETLRCERWVIEFIKPLGEDGSYTVVGRDEGGLTEAIAQADTKTDAWLAAAEWAMDKSDEDAE